MQPLPRSVKQSLTTSEDSHDPPNEPLRQIPASGQPGQGPIASDSSSRRLDGLSDATVSAMGLKFWHLLVVGARRRLRSGRVVHLGRGTT